MSAREPSLPPLLNPELRVADACCAAWLAQVSLRLRRELAWCRHQRGGAAADTAGALPPFTDPVQDSLDLLRFRDERRAFFEHDVAARYLSERIAAAQPPRLALERRGSFGWVARELGLSPAAQFVLACALAARADAAIGMVCAACCNDLHRPWPTLALAQRLWDDPLAVAACGDAGHALVRHGLLAPGHDAADWQQPLQMPAPVVQALLDPRSTPAGMTRMADLAARDFPPDWAPLLARLESDPPRTLQIVPLEAPIGTDLAAWAAALARAAGRSLMVIGDPALPERALAALASACWLHGADLLLPEHSAQRLATANLALTTLPLRWYLPLAGGETLRGVPPSLLLPALALPLPDTAERERRLARALDGAAPALRDAVPEAARRFRLADRPLQRAAAAARCLDASAGERELFALCRAEARIDLDGLAQPVAPRFRLDDLVLPPEPAQQLAEIAAAMRSLHRVHQDWGTARAWNEAGLAVLFCGPPGTGKTMAAEALAQTLALPIYRVDLSQVVNKYIGETEKNLRRIFDAAESCDTLIFFDEADALFGKRTEVRDAHDRFANIEISYLLERMERFKGLAVLASNRRKDLDEAFTRRLRHIVEFPMPGPAERETLWRQAFAPPVDTSALDCRWLAQQFELTGGHIRSAAFNACLAAAAALPPGAPPRLAMPPVLRAVRRELRKLNRVAADAQFGRYAAMLSEAA